MSTTAVQRDIPATTYMLHLLAALPRRNEWIFYSPTSATGYANTEAKFLMVSSRLCIKPSSTARPGEVLSLRWEDINTQWKGIQIRDKVEGTREIPATPYMLYLLAGLRVVAGTQ